VAGAKDGSMMDISVEDGEGEVYSKHEKRSPRVTFGTSSKRRRLSHEENLDEANGQILGTRRDSPAQRMTNASRNKDSITPNAAENLPEASESELSQRNTSVSSVLSLASHTPSVGDPPVRRDRPFVKQTSFRIRSSQEEENEEEEVEEEGFTLHHTQNVPEATYDSDSSLEDLDVLIARSSAGAKHAPRPNSNISSSERLTRSQMKPSINFSSSAQRKPFFSPLAPTPTYKFSLNNLVKQHTRDNTAQAEVAAAASAFLPSLSSGASVQPGLGPGTDQPMNTLSMEYQELLSRVKREGDGQDQVEKVMQAMNRTEAFRYEMNWYAFESAAATNKAHPRPCPLGSLKAEVKQLFQG